MSGKDVIFIALAAMYIRYLYRRDLLGSVVQDLSLIVLILGVWLFLVIATWQLMAYFGVPKPAAIFTEILGGAYLQFLVLAAVFYYKR